jgi:hypothetical protein
MKLIILISLFSFLAFSQDDKPLANLKLIDSVSEELRIIVDHLNYNEVSKDHAREVLAACELINNDTINMDSINLLFLIKSEIYKGLLNNQHLSYEDSVQISEVIVKSIEYKFKKHEVSYSPFAKWIFNSIIEDLKPYRANDFLNRYQTVSRTNMKEMSMALGLQKALKYISPWIIAIESQTPESFNNTLTLISIDILKLISRKTYFFKEFSFRFSQKQREAIFEIPKLALKPDVPIELPDSSLQKKKAQTKKTAKEAMKVLENTTETNGQKEAIDQLLNDETKQKKEWTPNE